MRREGDVDDGSGCVGGGFPAEPPPASEAERKFARFGAVPVEAFWPRLLAVTGESAGLTWTALCSMRSLNDMLFVASGGGQSIDASAVAKIDLMLERTRSESDPEGFAV